MVTVSGTGSTHPDIDPDPVCDLNYTPLEAVRRPVRVAVSNSLGFGGHDASVALRKM